MSQPNNINNNKNYVNNMPYVPPPSPYYLNDMINYNQNRLYYLENYVNNINNTVNLNLKYSFDINKMLIENNIKRNNYRNNNYSRNNYKRNNNYSRNNYSRHNYPRNNYSRNNNPRNNNNRPPNTRVRFEDNTEKTNNDSKQSKYKTFFSTEGDLKNGFRPFDIITSILSGKLVSEKNNKIKKEEDSDDEEIPYEYSSDDEFETFDTNINSLEDLINLCIDSKNIIDKYNEENKSKEMDDDMPELEENNPEVISKN